MPTYRNLDYEENSTGPEQEGGNIFRQLQKFVNRIGWFGKEINTNADDRVLTGYEKVQKHIDQELSSERQDVYDRLNKNYEVSQIERYREFENMERVSEVSSALDLIADECVQVGDNGHVINIVTKNEKVKEELEKLFFETLKIDNDAWDKVRTMILYGNRYEEIVINKKDPGILYLNYIDPGSIERHEEKGRLVCFNKVSYQDRDLRVTVYPEKDKQTAKTIQPFRIAHYRIEDSRFKPYGRSILESCRRTIRQLNMMEDAMTTYRYSRASEKRVWSIDCGELGPDEAMRYTQEVRDKLRKKPKWNPRTGELDWEMNPLCISLDTRIKLLDGRDLELKNIIKEYEEGKDLWTMSADEKGEYHIGKIKWAGITKRNTEVVKVTLDDGSEHITTPDHKFIMRDGSKCRADSLKHGDSLMPLYSKIKKANPKRKNTNNATYEYYIDLKDKKDKKLYRKVAQDCKTESIKDKVIHHKDFNTFNNNPENLKPMEWKEHAKFHYEDMWVTKREQILKSRDNYWSSEKGKLRKKELSKWRTKQNIKNNTVENMKGYNDSELHKEHDKIRSSNMKKRFSDKSYTKQFSESKTMVFDDFIYGKVKEAFIDDSINSEAVCNYLNSCPEFFEHLSKINKDKVICSEFNNMNRHFLLRIIRGQGFDSFEEYKQSLLEENFEEIGYNENCEYELLNYSDNPADRKRNTRMLFDEYLAYKVKEATIYEGETINNVAEYLNNDDNSLNHLKKINQNQNIPSNLDKFDKRIVLRLLNTIGHSSFKEFKETLKPNHKVLKVEHLDYKIDTGCIEVDNKWHNFPILCSANKKSKNYIFIKNSITEDFFIPVRTGMTNNSVQQLQGAQNLGEIDDVLYFKKKLFFALKIPLAFIGEEGLSYAKSNLALIDIRFARMIERIQRYFIKAIEKVAIIHLILRRFTVEDIKSFHIEATPASNIKKMTDMEFMNNKFAAIGNAKGLELFPDMWLLTQLWGATEEEAENLLKMMKIQKAGGDMEAGAEGGAGMVGGGDLDMGSEAMGPEAGAEGELPDMGGEEIAGGEAAEGEPMAGEAGGEEGGGELTASYDANKNPYAAILTEKLRKDPGARRRVYREFMGAWDKIKQKEAKKMEKLKVNIVNENYREFSIFGELIGANEHREELNKLLFESKKASRRNK